MVVKWLAESARDRKVLGSILAAAKLLFKITCRSNIGSSHERMEEKITLALLLKRALRFAF